MSAAPTIATLQIMSEGREMTASPVPHKVVQFKKLLQVVPAIALAMSTQLAGASTKKQTPTASNTVTQSSMRAPVPTALSPESSAQEIFNTLVAQGEKSASVYEAIYYGLANSANAQSLRATPEERESNARQLRINQNQFMQASDAQLSEQWQGSELTIKPTAQSETLGSIAGLKRGDVLKLGRQINISPTDLEEMFRTRVITDLFHHRLNYDDSKLQNLFQLMGLDLTKRLGFNIAYGGLGMSTTYFATAYAWPEGAPGKSDLKLWPDDQHPGSLIYKILLRISAPAEAIVKFTRNQALPAHVQANPHGYGFVQPTTGEGEVTFIDVIPSEWVTNLDALEQAYNQLKQKAQ